MHGDHQRQVRGALTSGPTVARDWLLATLAAWVVARGPTAGSDDDGDDPEDALDDGDAGDEAVQSPTGVDAWSRFSRSGTVLVFEHTGRTFAHPSLTFPDGWHHAG